jgi:hypothetical protein
MTERMRADTMNSMLIGERSKIKDYEHYRLEEIKLTAFGLGLQCPRDEKELADKAWIKTTVCVPRKTLVSTLCIDRVPG